jgi:hypothetical protein
VSLAAVQGPSKSYGRSDFSIGFGEEIEIAQVLGAADGSFVERGQNSWGVFVGSPTIMNSVPVSMSADNISTKSRFIDSALFEEPGLERQLPDHGDALAGSEISYR